MEQPDMMEAMMTLNPIAVTIFTISWTIGMAAMMFPAIIPMVFLYNRIISNEDNNNKNNEENDLSLVNKFKQHSNNSGRSENGQDITSFSHLSKRAIKTSGFIGTYLLVWALTGVLLLVFWSIIMNDLLMGIGTQEFSTVSGILLIVSGIYQFSPLKERCLGYCESPLSFFMKRWKGKQLKDGLKMGLYHGMYCLGCCWPYFLLMIALGWMNILWMGMFASIIFVEKVWSRGIWISRVAGLMFVITGMLSITGIISISTEEDGTLNPHDEMNSMMTQDSSNGSDNMNMNMNMNIKDNMTMKVEIS
jgi:predicted metal-binding membrane protein